MKIPNINQTGVPGAEQISLGAISSAAQGKMKATQSLTKVVDDYQAKVQKAETDEEYSRLSNGFTRDTGAAWEEIKTQAQVDGNGAPTHDQLMPQYQAAHDKILKDYKGRVKFNPNQAAFTQFADRTLTGNTNTIRGEAGRRTISHLSGAYQQSKIDLMNGANGLEDFSKVQESAVATGLVSSGQAAVDYDSFRHEFKTNQIMSQFKSEREMDRGEAYVANMAFPESFDEGEQQLMIDRMNADLRNDQVLVEREAAKVKRAADELEIKTWNAARKGKAILESGQPMTEEYLGQINDTISQLTDPDHQEQMSLSLDVYNNIQSVMSMTREDRTEAINQTFDPTTDYKGWVVQQSTKKAYGKIERAIASDPHQAFLMYGGGEPMEKITKDNIAESLVTAQDNQVKVSAWIGEDAPPMSMSQFDDIKRIGVPAIDDILTAYEKPEAEKILTLLYEKEANEMAVVGAIALQADGEPVYASYLEGADHIKNDPSYQVGSKRNLSGDTKDSLFHNATMGLFPNHVGFSKGLKDVATKIYAKLAHDNQIIQGELDSDLYSQAVEMATGKIIDYSGTPLLMPRRDWDKGRFTDAIDDLSLVDINKMGGFESVEYDAGDPNKRTVSPEQMLTKLKGGGADLRQGNEFGQYFVSFGNRVVTNAAGEPFILDLGDK